MRARPAKVLTALKERSDWKKPDCIEQLFTGAHETVRGVLVGDVRTCSAIWTHLARSRRRCSAPFRNRGGAPNIKGYAWRRFPGRACPCVFGAAASADRIGAKLGNPAKVKS